MSGSCCCCGCVRMTFCGRSLLRTQDGIGALRNATRSQVEKICKRQTVHTTEDDREELQTFIQLSACLVCISNRTLLCYWSVLSFSVPCHSLLVQRFRNEALHTLLFFCPSFSAPVIRYENANDCLAVSPPNVDLCI